jgi:hypothetical protein
MSIGRFSNHVSPLITVVSSTTKVADVEEGLSDLQPGKRASKVAATKAVVCELIIILISY